MNSWVPLSQRVLVLLPIGAMVAVVFWLNGDEICTVAPVMIGWAVAIPKDEEAEYCEELWR